MMINPEEYASAAIVFEEVGNELLARLEWVKLQPQRIVEINCRTGHCTRLLRKRYPDVEIIALDHSKEMLTYASATSQIDCRWVHAPEDNVPLPDKSIDLVIANLVLPWCSNLENVLREWRRILRPEGLLAFTALGPDTLQELQREKIMLSNLIDMHDLGDLILRSGFIDPVMDVEHTILRYREEKKLMRELMTTHMISQPQAEPLTPNPDGNFLVTYEVIYGHAWGPALTAEHVADESGVIKIPLSHLRRS
jgi:malonyl-CoA O-methyltransferase